MQGGLVTSSEKNADQNATPTIKISVDLPRGQTTLAWPHRCTCCGDKAASQNLKLSYSLTSGNRNISETRTTSWSAPVCSQCLRHYRCDSGKDVEPIQTTLVFLGFVTGIGFIALFRAGGPFPLFAGGAVPEFLPWVALIALLLLPVG